MNDYQQKVELARAKLDKAWEAWDEAIWCFKGKKYPAVINRLYYSLFRACLAVLTFEPQIPSKHTAVIGRVNKQFVREGLLSKDIGKFLHALQTARIEGDYKAKEFTLEEVEGLLEQGKVSLHTLEELTEKIITDYK